MNQATRTLVLTVAAAQFMEQMDGSIIATSLPSIARDLATDAVALKLAFTTYLLAMTVVLPASGWISDRFSARNVFAAAIVVFTLGSVACGFASNLYELVVARALQGAGGALMVPVGRIVLLRSVDKSQLVDAMALLAMPALIGPFIGPTLGGFITDTFGWRWIFFMHLPFGILAFALALVLMPDHREASSVRFDLKGYLLSSLGLSLTVFGITVLGRGFLSAAWIATLIGIGISCLFAYAAHARVHSDPILDPKLLRIQTFRLSVYGGNLFRIIVGAAPFLLPLMLQLGFGMSATKSGLITGVAALGAIAMKFCAASLLKQFGYRPLLIGNGIASVLTMMAMAFLQADTYLPLMIGLIFFSAFLRSLQFTALNSMAYADIDRADMGKATAFYTVAQQLALTLGVAVAAFALDGSMWWRGGIELVPSDFSAAYVFVGMVSITSILFYLKLSPEAGAKVSGKSY